MTRPCMNPAAVLFPEADEPYDLAPVFAPRRIAKGAVVLVRTTNGGEITGRLLENYRATYDALVEFGTGFVRILAPRILTIAEVTAQKTTRTRARERPIEIVG